MTRMLGGALLAALAWWLFCRVAAMPERVLEVGFVAIVLAAVLLARPRDPQ